MALKIRIKKPAKKPEETKFKPPLKATKPKASPTPPKKDRSLQRPDGKPRFIDLYTVTWVEVFASKNEEELTKARNLLNSELMSAYSLLDPEKGERILMTSEHFFPNAIRLLQDHKFAVWGSGKS